MNKIEHDELRLERFIKDELARLPAVTAPPGLAERVFLSIEAKRSEPWWKKPLWSWPRSARITASLGFISLACGIIVLQALYPISSWFDSSWVNELRAGFAQLPSVFSWRLSEFSPLMGRSWMTILLLTGSLAYGLVILLGSAFCRLAFCHKREA